MIRPTLRGLLLLLLVALPWLALVPLGLLWLWQKEALIVWLLLAAGVSLVAWLARHWWRRGASVEKPALGADEHWPERDRQVWAAVEQQAAGLRLADYPLDGTLPHRLLDLGLATAREVARHYYPEAREPELQVSLPHLLRSCELVCRDLRRLTDYIPLSHRITLAHWKRAPGLMKLAQLYDVWRLARLVMNPAAALATELRGALQGKLFSQSRDELMLWLLQEYVKGTGRHAIELYSGNLFLGRESVTAPLGEDEPIPDESPEEPFRVLLLGQVGSGKSSLVNALFGELRAGTDTLAHTAGFTAYRLEHDGLPAALVLDSPGYGGTEPPDPASLDRELLRTDLVLLVCAASQAGRDPDRTLLDRLRRLYREHPDREPPGLVCALTHIDRLRPIREWSPPYDIDRPQTDKAIAIRSARDALAETLDLDPGRVVPVRTDAEQVYNVIEALMPHIMNSLQNEAARARYLRCLRSRQRGERWSKVLEQAGNAGRLLLQAAGDRLRQWWSF